MALAFAIQARLMCREALDADDMARVRTLNRAADAAYLRLSPFEAAAYLEWARSTSGPQPVLFAGGDA